MSQETNASSTKLINQVESLYRLAFLDGAFNGASALADTVLRGDEYAQEIKKIKRNAVSKARVLIKKSREDLREQGVNIRPFDNGGVNPNSLAGELIRIAKNSPNGILVLKTALVKFLSGIDIPLKYVSSKDFGLSAKDMKNLRYPLRIIYPISAIGIVAGLGLSFRELSPHIRSVSKEVLKDYMEGAYTHYGGPDGLLFHLNLGKLGERLYHKNI